MVMRSIYLSIIIYILLISCSGTIDPDDEYNVESELIGRWECIKKVSIQILINNDSITVEEFPPFDVSSSFGNQIVDSPEVYIFRDFYEDGSFIESHEFIGSGSMFFNGVYIINNNSNYELTFIVNKGSGPDSTTYTGNLEVDKGNNIIVWTRESSINITRNSWEKRE
jgi:hypothetical protein